MKNKLLLSLIISVFCFGLVFGQTTSISIGSITANPGDEINIPIDVSNFTDIGAITLYIGYDPAVLSFQGLNNIDPQVSGISGNAMSNPDQIGLVWTASPPNYANIGSGKMLDMTFTYIGGSCDLTFNAGCEITNSGLIPIPVNYTDGSVGPASQSITATIGSVTASPGDEVLIPVDVTGFLDVGAITLYIEYDEAVLSFVGIESINPDVTGILAYTMTDPSRIGIVWAANPPTYANIASGKLVDLKFVYNGGNSDLTFSEDCEISDSGAIPLYVEYFNGDISQTITSITAQLGNVAATIGQEILVPLDVANFTDVAAITFYIGYDPSVLSFVGLENIATEVAGISANVMTSPDQISIAWSDVLNAFNYTGKLLDLKFVYNGGNSDLVFNPGCDVSNSVLISLPVTYYDGSVSLAVETFTINIDTVFTDIGTEVLVSVNTTDFADIGAMTLFIGFDPSALSFIGLENVNSEIAGSSANVMSGPYRIGIGWDASPPNLANIASGKLFDLKFVFNGGDGNLTFLAGCELSNSNLAIVPVNLIDGGVFPPLYVNFNAFLEGPFNGSAMNVILNSELPLSQPFNVAPWDYPGTESVSSIPNLNVVDWILIELRETPFDAATATDQTVIARRAGFILDDGTIVDPESLNPIRFEVVVSHNLFGIIWHRNHLGIMSSQPLSVVTGVLSYNFTTSEDKAYGQPNPQKEVAPGVWAMIAGDGNKDGKVDAADKSMWSSSAGQSGYLQGDYNMDTQINNCDKNESCSLNFGNQTRVPE